MGNDVPAQCHGRGMGAIGRTKNSHVGGMDGGDTGNKRSPAVGWRFVSHTAKREAQGTEAMQRVLQLDESAKMLAYLDGACIVARKSHAQNTIEMPRCMESPDSISSSKKTQVGGGFWQKLDIARRITSPGTPFWETISSAVGTWRTHRVLWVRKRGTIWARLKRLVIRMDEAIKNGLTKHGVAALLKVYAGASSQSVLRLGTASGEAIRTYDAVLRQTWEKARQIYP